MEKETAEKILQETEQGYDSIAEKFSQTRKHFWRGLEFMADYTKTGDTVLDFGCGNGRLLELIGDRKPDYYGTDVSVKLIEIAEEKYNDNVTELGSVPEPSSDMRHFVKIDPIQTSLPYPDGFFNTAYSIAVFHHFPSKEYRENAVKELYRVVKKDGYIIVTVWNLWPASTRGNDRSPASTAMRLSSNRGESARGGQQKYLKNIIRNWFEKLKGNNELDWNDCYINFKDNQGKVFSRFHHAYTKRELRKIFTGAGFKVEKCEIIEGRNIVLIGKK